MSKTTEQWLAEAAETLRHSARKPGLPAPTPEHQAKNRAIAVRKVRLAARKR